MFLKMDSAWKFGCGRYIQKPGAILELKAEIERLGEKALFISGFTAWETVFTFYKDMFSGMDYELIRYHGSCNEKAARVFVERAAEKELDVVVGIGGGKIMDLAKLTGDIAGKPIINIPTICATCAAYTPLSVIYTPEGRALGSWFFENEINCIIADTAILAQQPARYAFAGIADTLAKIIEIQHNIHYLSSTTDMEFAKYNARYLYERLMEIAPKLPEELEKGKPSALIDEMVYLIIAATGIVSGSARGQGQSAMAHALYETARTLYTEEASRALHGEIVGVGLRIQQRYDGDDPEALDSAMKSLGLPMRLHEVGIPESDTEYIRIAEAMKVNPLLAGQNIDPQRLARVIAEIR